MSKPESPCSSAAEMARKAEFAARGAASFEAQVVHDILRFHKLSRWRHQLMDRHAELYGDRQLTVAVFMEQFPSFPVHLSVKRIPRSLLRSPAEMWVSPARLTNLYNKNVTKVGSFAQEYFCMVSSWPSINTVMVLSDYPPDSTNGACTVYWYDGNVYCWEPFVRFLTRLRWFPDESDLTL